MSAEASGALAGSRGRGFTIIEILISVGIIAILAALGVTLYNNWYDPRARSAEVMEQYDAMRTRFEEDYRANGQRADCSGLNELAKGNLDSRYVDLALTTLPMDKNAPDKGHRLALAVSGTVDKHQPRGVRIARAVHDNLVKSGVVMPDAILSDSVVLFALRLTDGPMCQVAMGPSAPGAVASSSTGGTPPVPAAASVVAPSGGAQPAPAAALAAAAGAAPQVRPPVAVRTGSGWVSSIGHQSSLPVVAPNDPNTGRWYSVGGTAGTMTSGPTKGMQITSNDWVVNIGNPDCGTNGYITVPRGSLGKTPTPVTVACNDGGSLQLQLSY